MLFMWSPSWPSAIAKAKVRGGCWIFGPMLIRSSQVLKKPPPVTGSMTSLRQWAGQQSTAYGAAYTLPSGAVSDETEIGSKPPAIDLNLPTSDVRSAYSPCVYQ